MQKIVKSSEGTDKERTLKYRLFELYVLGFFMSNKIISLSHFIRSYQLLSAGVSSFKVVVKRQWIG